MDRLAWEQYITNRRSGGEKKRKTLIWPTAKLYTSVYLKQEDKDRIAEMVEEIKEAYHGIIEEADFLSDETRANAIAKLDAIKCHSLYPDNWENTVARIWRSRGTKRAARFGRRCGISTDSESTDDQKAVGCGR